MKTALALLVVSPISLAIAACGSDTTDSQGAGAQPSSGGAAAGTGGAGASGGTSSAGSGAQPTSGGIGGAGGTGGTGGSGAGSSGSAGSAGSPQGTGGSNGGAGGGAPQAGAGGGGAGGSLGGGGAGGSGGGAGSSAAGSGGSGGTGVGGGSGSNVLGWAPGIGYQCPSIPKPVCNAGNPTSYPKNTGNLGTHDPAIFADKDCNFYVVASHALLPNKKSKDLVAWSSYSPPSFQMPSWTGAGSEVWASDPVYIDGRYLIYFSNWRGAINTARIGLITSNALDSGWKDGGITISRELGGNAGPGKGNVNIIDPNFFVDFDGSWWLIYGSFNDGVRITALDKATGKPKDNPIKPSVVTDHLGEGSSLFRHKDYYYVAVSRGKCCSGTSSEYEVIYARSTSVTGPYITKSGGAFATSTYAGATDALMRVGFDGNPGGEGGQQFFQVNGQWYIVYHAYASSGTNLVVRPIYFDSAGWLTYDCSKSVE